MIEVDGTFLIVLLWAFFVFGWTGHVLYAVWRDTSPPRRKKPKHSRLPRVRLERYRQNDRDRAVLHIDDYRRGGR
jgi:hypothetical protein